MARIEVGEIRLVRLYHDWLNSSFGDAFQHIVNEMRAGWQAKEQPILKFAEEMKNMVADAELGSLRIPARQLKLLDIASSVILGVPQRRAFVRLALAISAMEKDLQVTAAASDGNHGVVTDELPPLQPSILKLLQTMQQQNRKARSGLCSQEEREYIKLAVYPLPFGEVEVEFGSVFDVTKPVCELVFSWLEQRQDVLKLVDGMDARLHSGEEAQALELPIETTAPISKLICTFLMNAEVTAPANLDAVKRMLASGCKFFGNSAGELTPAVEELCKEAVESATAPLATAWLCNKSLMYQMCELQRRTKLVAVNSAMVQMRRLYNTWIQHWDDEQRRLLQEEQALDACVCQWEQDRARWESLCPYGPAAARNFANVVAAASRVQAVEKTHLVELDVIYSGAIIGEYECLKPHYPGSGDIDPAEKSVSWVVMRMVETALIFYRRKHFVNGLTDDDEPRMLHLPVASRDAAEQRVFGPTLVMCRDMTRPACRILEMWSKNKPSAPRKDLGGYETMLRCFEANGYRTRDRCGVDVNLDATVAALDASRESLALLSDGVEVRPFLSAAVTDVRRAFQKQMSNDDSERGPAKRLKPDATLINQD